MSEVIARYSCVAIGCRDYTVVSVLMDAPADGSRIDRSLIQCRRRETDEWFDWTFDPVLPAAEDMRDWEFRVRAPDEIMFGDDVA